MKYHAIIDVSIHLSVCVYACIYVLFNVYICTVVYFVSNAYFTYSTSSKGEIGVDKAYRNPITNKNEFTMMVDIFEQQFEIATRLKRAVVIHNVSYSIHSSIYPSIHYTTSIQHASLFVLFNMPCICNTRIHTSIYPSINTRARCIYIRCLWESLFYD